jgi:hypothetical protein
LAFEGKKAIAWLIVFFLQGLTLAAAWQCHLIRLCDMRLHSNVFTINKFIKMGETARRFYKNVGIYLFVGDVIAF